MRGCQTCTHSIPTFVTSNIYMDGYSQICRDCKAGKKDGYEPVYGEEPKKYIIELSENDYMALKEDGVQNHLALADSIIAHSVPYEERPKGTWMKEPNGKTTDIYRCSVCKRSIMLCKGANLTNYPFCHCGADMRGGDIK